MLADVRAASEALLQSTLRFQTGAKAIRRQPAQPAILTLYGPILAVFSRILCRLIRYLRASFERRLIEEVEQRKAIAANAPPSGTKKEQELQASIAKLQEELYHLSTKENRDELLVSRCGSSVARSRPHALTPLLASGCGRPR